MAPPWHASAAGKCSYVFKKGLGWGGRSISTQPFSRRTWNELAAEFALLPSASQPQWEPQCHEDTGHGAALSPQPRGERKRRPPSWVCSSILDLQSHFGEGLAALRGEDRERSVSSTLGASSSSQLCLETPSGGEVPPHPHLAATFLAPGWELRVGSGSDAVMHVHGISVPCHVLHPSGVTASPSMGSALWQRVALSRVVLGCTPFSQAGSGSGGRECGCSFWGACRWGSRVPGRAAHPCMGSKELTAGPVLMAFGGEGGREGREPG